MTSFRPVGVLLVCLVAMAAAVPVRQVNKVQTHPRSVPRLYLEQGQDLSVPSGWKAASISLGTETVTLTFALKQQNLAKLESTFWAVSTPGNPQYGKHLSFDEVNALTRPAPATIRAVDAWLREHSIRPETACSKTVAMDFWKCEMNIVTAETLLQTRFFHYVNKEISRSILRSPSHYTVPASVAPHLDFIGGVHRFPKRVGVQVDKKFAEEQRKKGVKSELAFAVTPYLLRARYNVSMAYASSEKNSQSVAQFLGQYFSKLDLDEFFTLFDEGLKKTYKVTVVGPNSGLAGTEASLDIQYIMSMGANVSTTFWSTGGHHDNQEPFLEWITAVGNTTNPPIVNSVSYGDDEGSLSVSYMERVNAEFMKQGSRGLSILFASGDNGVGVNQAGNKFAPNFPATSPYVTAVGGTVYVDEKTETANYISSGGFSNVFARPSYQDSAVGKFLNTTNPPLPPKSWYNETGRGFPDVAALSQGFVIVANLIPTPGVAGTSCAAPTFSGIVSLLNDLRLNAGKAPLGFLNPFLYGQGLTGLYDVTKDCNQGPVNQIGFCAAPGWDAVTGLGTPNFDALKNLV